jgi:hypothetical protein
MNTKIRLITRMAFGFKDATPPSSPSPCSALAAIDPTYQAVNPLTPPTEATEGPHNPKTQQGRFT